VLQSSSTRIKVSILLGDLRWSGRVYAILAPAQDDPANPWPSLLFNFSVVGQPVNIADIHPSSVPPAAAAIVRLSLTGIREPPAAGDVAVIIGGTFVSQDMEPTFDSSGLFILSVTVPPLASGLTPVAVVLVAALSGALKVNLTATGVLIVVADDVGLTCVDGCNYTLGSAVQQVLSLEEN
jgi:hypothetical protein